MNELIFETDKAYRLWAKTVQSAGRLMRKCPNAGVYRKNDNKMIHVVDFRYTDGRADKYYSRKQKVIRGKHKRFKKPNGLRRSALMS